MLGCIWETNNYDSRIIFCNIQITIQCSFKNCFNVAINSLKDNTACAVTILTSALSKPLQVASPDWASLYSASLELSVLGPPANEVYKSSDNVATVCKEIAYPSARRFSRKQSNDNVPHSKWHDDATQDRPNSGNCHPSKSPGMSTPQLQCNTRNVRVRFNNNTKSTALIAAYPYSRCPGRRDKPENSIAGDSLRCSSQYSTPGICTPHGRDYTWI